MTPLRVPSSTLAQIVSTQASATGIPVHSGSITARTFAKLIWMPMEISMMPSSISRAWPIVTSMRGV